MFDALSKNVVSALSKLRGKKRLGEGELRQCALSLKEALIDADVTVEVAQSFMDSVLKRSVGADAIEGVNADEQFVAIVNDELINLMGGGKDASVRLNPTEKISVILLFGLQGAGKTTTAGKLAEYYKKERKVLLVGTDVHRPAAMDQLEVLAKNASVACHVDKKEKQAHKILKKALFIAKKESYNLVIVDTAGRLEVDNAMMQELNRLSKMSEPVEKLLVVDSTIGQSVFDIARVFKEHIGISGVILTKFDSDAKGGAALSLRYATDTFVKFVGVGEHLGDIDEFSAERVAGRLLGMGDVVKLVKKAQEAISEQKASEMLKKVIENNFDYNDFLEQLGAAANMGGLESIASMLPGGQSFSGVDFSGEERKLGRFKAIIQSMTKKERLDLFPLNNSRKMRIAKGSGTSVYEVNQLLKQFGTVKGMLGSKKKMGKMLGAMENMGLSMDDVAKMMR